MNCTPSLSNSLMSVRQFITDQRGCITRYYLTHCVSQTPLHLTLMLHCTAHTTHTASHCTYCSAMLCTVRTVASTDVQCNALYLLHSIVLHHISSLYESVTNQRGFPSLLSTKGRGFHLNGSVSYTATCTSCGELHPPHDGGRENSLDLVCVPLTPCTLYINTYTHHSHCLLFIAQYHVSLSGGIDDLVLHPPTKAHLYLYILYDCI